MWKNKNTKTTPYANVLRNMDIKRGWIIIVASDDDDAAAAVVLNVNF